jgi:secreted trypsin-like serine protease
VFVKSQANFSQVDFIDLKNISSIQYNLHRPLEILPGKIAKAGDYPFYVYIKTYEHNHVMKKTCGGAIIDKKWILTVNKLKL